MCRILARSRVLPGPGGADVLAYVRWRRGMKFRHRRTGRCGKDVEIVRAMGVVSNATINRELTCFRAAVAPLVRHGVVDGNPFSGVDAGPERTRTRCVLSKGDARRLIDACSHRLRAIVVALLYTSARWGELASLRWRDVDLEAGRIALVRTKVGNVASIPIHPVLREELERIRDMPHPGRKEGPATSVHADLRPDGRRAREGEHRGARLRRREEAERCGKRNPGATIVSIGEGRQQKGTA